MSLFAPPELIETEVFAEVPARLRKKGTPPERLAAGKSETPAGCFLEGPAFDRAGNLYVVDLAYGRIFRISSKGVFETFAEYDGEPNGIAIHKDGRVCVAGPRAIGVGPMPVAPDGRVVRRGVQIQLSGGRGPDGLALDEAGGLAVAHPDMGAVWIFNHRGEPMYRVQSCVNDMVTNVAYAGNSVYITDSGSGSILKARVPTAGRALFSHS